MFLRFPDLPAEIRESIWFYCLPHRIAQRDDPLFVDYVREEQKCWSRRTYRQNAAPPLISSVCYESREVALRYGIMSPPEHYNRLVEPIWIQHRLDILHMNWTETYDLFADQTIQDPFEFFYEALELLPTEMPISLASEHICGFWLEREPEETGYAYFMFQEKIELFIQYFYAFGQGSYSSDISATIAFICVHATKAQALESNLFGLLGDALVQLVDFTDAARLEAFHCLFKKGCSNHKRPEVVKLFASILAPSFLSRVQAWKRKADWLIMSYAWLRARYSHRLHIPITGDPNLVWTPRFAPRIRNGESIVYMGGGASAEEEQTNLFDELHPWVMQAKQELPSVAPKVLFSLCTDECDVDGNIVMVRYGG